MGSEAVGWWVSPLTHTMSMLLPLGLRDKGEREREMLATFNCKLRLMGWAYVLRGCDDAFPRLQRRDEKCFNKLVCWVRLNLARLSVCFHVFAKGC
jgi:hypothetical protein